MNCPHCSFDIKLLSEPWQRQREASNKHCPACGGIVEVVLDGRTFVRWLCITGVVMVMGLLVMGLDWPVALFIGFVFGLSISVLPSFSLRAREEHEKGLRSLLNRPILLPQWLTAAKRTRAFGRGAWATLSVVAIVLVTLLNIPSPWSGVLLLCAGGFGLWRKTVWFSWFKIEGNGALAYSIVLILVGAAIVFTTYG